MTIASAFFDDSRSVFRFIVDSDVVTATRFDDTTFLLRLPVGPSGDIRLGVNGHDAGIISRVGFRDSQTYPGGWISTINSFPQGPVGLGPTGLGPMGMWDLGAGSSSVLEQFTTGGFGPGPSFRGSDVAVLMDTAGMIGEWRLSPTLQFIDTVRVGTNHQRLTAVIAPDAYLLAFGNGTTSQFHGSSTFFSGDEATRGFIATLAGRALLDGSALRVPVFDAATGDSAFTLPITQVASAVFSDDGTRLYAVGRITTAVYNRLLVVDPATGAVLTEDSLPPGIQGLDLALDVSESLLFLAADVGNTPHILVLDSQTLQSIGTLSLAAGSTDTCDFSRCLNSRVAIDESRQTVYLTLPGDPLIVHRFDLLQ